MIPFFSFFFLIIHKGLLVPVLQIFYNFLQFEYFRFSILMITIRIVLDFSIFFLVLDIIRILKLYEKQKKNRKIMYENIHKKW